jgi:hypothetical protein
MQDFGGPSSDDALGLGSSGGVSGVGGLGAESTNGATPQKPQKPAPIAHELCLRPAPMAALSSLVSPRSGLVSFSLHPEL